MSDAVLERLQATLGKAYTIERELGGGGMSRVFLAVESAFGRQVVVKVLPPEMAGGVSIERFKREIQLAARLQHPHVVPLLTAGDADGLPYFTMPYIEGESLRTRLTRHGELPVSEAVRVLREIASALAYAHEHGVVHRDIKPDNVLLSGGAAMVTDFGVAKALSSSSEQRHAGVTSLGVALGTPAYMSPEQASADPSVDHRADVYAFGVLAYELLTGQTPFSGRTPQGLLAAHVTETPEAVQRRRPSVPPALAALVMRCLEKHAADRPQSAVELVHQLDGLTSGSSSPTNAAVNSPSGRGRTLLVAGSVVALAIAGTFAWRRADHRAAAAEPRSLAVMPLENAGGDTTMQFFADGMTDELTSAVAKIPGLRVASRSATTAALGAPTGDSRSLGQRLAVGALLQGRIRRLGNRMRLTAELTNTGNGLILWTDSYDREVKDAFQVQEDVARAIAAALQVTLAGEHRPLATRTTENPEAHDLYLRGRYVQAKYTEADLRKSLDLFHAALAKDPKYSAAWAGIADSWGMLADDYMRPRDANPKTRDAVARALAIDSTNPEARCVGALNRYYLDHDPHAAAQEMAVALGGSTQLAWCNSYYPLILWTAGHRDSAARFVRQVAERDPTSPKVLNDASAYFLRTGDTSTARRYCDGLADLGAAEACSADLDAAAGRPERAIALYQPRMTDANPRTAIFARASLVGALVKAGRMTEAKALASAIDAEARSGRRYIREDVVARIWALTGDGDRALYWLERALTSESTGIGGLYALLADVPLRRDPRVLAFAKRAGLPNPPPYWR